MQWNISLEHCNGNSVYIFLFWELCGLSPNFHIHVSVSDLYIPRIGPHISSSRKGRPIMGIYNSLTDTWMWKLGLGPRYSFSGNICFKFWAFCLCSEGHSKVCCHVHSPFFIIFYCLALAERPKTKLNFCLLFIIWLKNCQCKLNK